jgi:3-hydroxyisobutyrate dehydrogenase-like beta-hydroxyacid dehydrogenase
MGLIEKARETGVTFIDAPLSRTPKEAWDGTLDVMIGADDITFDLVAPVIDAFAGRIIRVGVPGNAHKMKLVNNFLAMSYGALYSEALTLAAKVGVEPEVFDSVIRGGRMESPFYLTFMKYVLERDVNAHRFAIRNAHKDMRYVAEMANSAGVANWIGSAVKNYYAVAEATGHGDENVPQVSDVIAAMSGVKLA